MLPATCLFKPRAWFRSSLADSTRVVIAFAAFAVQTASIHAQGSQQATTQPKSPASGQSLAQRLFTPIETRDWLLTTEVFLPACELENPAEKPSSPAGTSPGKPTLQPLPNQPPTRPGIKPPRRPTTVIFLEREPRWIPSLGQYATRGSPTRPGGGGYSYSTARRDRYAYSTAKPVRPRSDGSNVRPDKPGNLALPCTKKFTWDDGVVFTPAGITTTQHTPQSVTAATLWLDDKEYPISAPLIREQLQSGARYFEFLFEKFSVPTSIRIQTVQPYRASELRFNEQLAMSIRWHTDTTPWPAEFKSALEPVILNEYLEGIEGGQPDPIAAEAALSRKEISGLLSKWTQGQDLRSLPPLTAAKFITAKVLETFPPTGRAQIGEDGEPIYGFSVQTIPELIVGKLPKDVDVPAILAAFLRTAGFPARTVYGLDVRRRDGVTDRSLRTAPIGKPAGMRVWTEFALFDQETKQAVWIPVDILQQRQTSSKAPDVNRPWPWFGSNEDSAYVVPIAFHLLPPLPAMTFGEPNFVSFFFQPVTPAGRAALLFTVREPSSTEREKFFTRR